MKSTFMLLAVAGLLLLGSPVLAEPEFQYLGFSDVGGGVYEHHYKLSNLTVSAPPVYDVDFEYTYAHGWLYVETPPDWGWAHDEPSWWRFATDTAPCVSETEIYGYTIAAATPVVGNVTFQYTDVNHVTFASGPGVLPLPEPASALLALGGLVFVARRRR